MFLSKSFLRDAHWNIYGRNYTVSGIWFKIMGELLGIYLKEMKTHVHTGIFTAALLLTARVETTQMSIKWRLDKQNVVSPYTGISSSHKVKWGTWTDYSMDEPQKYDAGTSLVAQWLGLWGPNAGSSGSIPGEGTRSHRHVASKNSHANREGGREGDARGKRYGDVCICITDSLCYTAETNTPL